MSGLSTNVLSRNGQLVREYLDWMRDTRGRRGVTVYNYASTLARFLDAIGDTPLANVSVAQMEAYVTRPRGGRAHGKAGSASSQAKDVAILRSLFNYLLNRGHVERNPAALLGAPRVRNENPRPIPDRDWLALWNSDLDLDERVVFGLGFYVGLRRREVCELRPDQVLAGRLVSFTRKGGGDDITPFVDLCNVLEERLPHLRAHEFPAEMETYVTKRQGHAYLLGWGEELRSTAYEQRVHALDFGMTDPQQVNRHLRRVCVRAGLPAYTPHQLRHSFVTNLLRAGVPLHLVQRMANHTSPAITSRYIKAGGSELREWMRGIGRHS